MKTFIFAFLHITLLAQNDMHIYTNEEITIHFNNKFWVLNQESDLTANYFNQAHEIIRFNERPKQNIPEGVEVQSLMPPKQQLIMPQSLHSPTEIEDIEPEEFKHYNSISNDFFEDDAMFVLPSISFSKVALSQEIDDYLKDDAHYQVTKAIQKEKIGNQEVWTWRIQAGKTRLDHYLVESAKHNYLFVSSPYSDANGSIRKLISENL